MTFCSVLSFAVSSADLLFTLSGRVSSLIFEISGGAVSFVVCHSRERLAGCHQLVIAACAARGGAHCHAQGLPCQTQPSAPAAEHPCS